jgi:hypothetical protein
MTKTQQGDFQRKISFNRLKNILQVNKNHDL